METNDTQIVFHLINILEEKIISLDGNVLYNEDFMRISCAILRIVYRNLYPAGIVDFTVNDAIDKNNGIYIKSFFQKINGREENSLAGANQLPFFITNMMVDRSVGILFGNDFASMIRHAKSDVRLCIFRTLWLVKDRLDNLEIIQGLLYNLAENRGYISEAAGLLRGILGDDERFFDIASKYEPAAIWKEQYENRIKQIEDNKLLPACMKLLMDFENEIAELESVYGNKQL